MAVYIGPCSYGTPEPSSGERYITTDSSNGPSNVISVEGDLDMKKRRIFNLQEPRAEEPSDATTVSYVGRLASSIYNKKVNWSGGKMTGPLSLAGYKLTHVGNPEENQDVVNKQYLENVLQQMKPFEIGRYIVHPHVDKTRSYMGVGSKRNIDLIDGKVFELFNDNVHNPQQFATSQLDRTLVPVPEKSVNIMHLDSQLVITPKSLSNQWTFLFSIKPDNLPNFRNDLIVNFREHTPGIHDSIVMSWSQNTFTYVISGQDPISIEVDASILNHFAFEYDNRRLVVWINGRSRKTHNDLALSGIEDIRLGINFLAITSIYNRGMSKHEVGEHFIKYHVKPFTNDEVFD